ncbi:alpha/beta hydrolase [Streptomyces katrae]|uniref:Alpha/beta hydrolase n=1 Tax=Streptomyces katrae TaxID=68223 RepID=A0ABT7H5H8_9ACTN|nr:alpha/beta hydrolase [Streptomyces katrae]MDK9501144.1 alpha/beta hydrolase [Streptomyces katrae]
MGTKGTGVLRRAGLAAGAALLLFSTLPAVTATAAEGAARPEWCPTVEGHRVDCGSMTRPLVSGRPGLGTVDVAYAVVRHRSPGPAKGTVAVNPGGPGEVAVERAPVFGEVLKDLLGDHDLLLVDPRGTGRSQRIPCGVTDAEYRFGTRQEQRDAVTRCAANLGPRARGYTTAATADDLDAVRARLGVDRLTLYGLSYGTYLMPVYASRHPGHVRDIVLSGAYPLAFDPLNRPGAQAVSLSLRRICERSAARPEAQGRPACDGDKAVRDLAATAAALRERPVDVDIPLEGAAPFRMRLTEGKLANLVYEGASREVGADPGAPSLLGGLPHALDRFAAGDRAPLLDLVRAEGSTGSAEDQAPYIAVVCNDYRKPWKAESSLPERWRQYRGALAGAADRPGAFGAFSPAGYLEGPTDGGDVCIGWPRENTAGPQPTHPRMPDVPVLVLSGDLDANTPDANGRLAARQFRDSRFVSVRNTGHVPEMEHSGCVVDLSTRFIRTGRTGDTGCVETVEPIAVTPVRR